MENRREAFRVELFDLPVCVHVKGSLDVVGRIYDLSGVGMGMFLDQALSNEVKIIDLTFYVQKETFQCRGEIIRTRVDGPIEIYYGVKFLDLSITDESKLMSILLRLDGIRRMRDRE